MPLYRGASVKDALGKALGKPTSYGNNPKQSGKPQARLLFTSDDLGELRSQAMERAEAYLANANYEAGQPEDGYAEIFLLDDQKVEELPGRKCGRPVTGADGTPKWQYSFPLFRGRPFFVLVFAHSHPNISRNPTNEEARMLCRPSTPRPTSPESDRDLYPYAPVVIGCANGTRRWNVGGTFIKWDR